MRQSAAFLTFISSLSSLASAKPVPPNSNSNSLTLPSSSLSAPSGSLLHLAIGIGHQNYSCSSGAPVLTGATASLFNVLPLLTTLPELSPYLSFLAFSGLAAPAQSSAAADNAALGIADMGIAVPAVMAQFGHSGDEARLGDHFFDASGSPIFNLFGAAHPAVVQGKKAGGVPAPADAMSSPVSGSVDWLQLVPTGAQGFDVQGIEMVYRVETVGGKAVCGSDVGAGQVVRVPYTALYWFYGTGPSSGPDPQPNKGKACRKKNSP